MPYTLGQAAKATGKTKSTICEAIKKGRISAQKDDFGRYQIDPAELHRVYAPKPAAAPTERDQTQETAAENRELKARLEVMEQLLREVMEARDKISEDRDHWRRQATALLPSPAPQAPPPRPWWLWFCPW